MTAQNAKAQRYSSTLMVCVPSPVQGGPVGRVGRVMQAYGLTCLEYGTGGAAIGGAIGNVVPGPGTAFGGVTGGLLGCVGAVDVSIIVDGGVNY